MPCTSAADLDLGRRRVHGPARSTCRARSRAVVELGVVDRHARVDGDRDRRCGPCARCPGATASRKPRRKPAPRAHTRHRRRSVPCFGFTKPRREGGLLRCRRTAGRRAGAARSGIASGIRARARMPSGHCRPWTAPRPRAQARPAPAIRSARARARSGTLRRLVRLAELVEIHPAEREGRERRDRAGLVLVHDAHQVLHRVLRVTAQARGIRRVHQRRRIVLHAVRPLQCIERRVVLTALAQAAPARERGLPRLLVARARGRAACSSAVVSCAAGSSSSAGAGAGSAEPPARSAPRPPPASAWSDLRPRLPHRAARTRGPCRASRRR